MIIEAKTYTFKDFDIQSYTTTRGLLAMLEERNEFKEKLISIFNIDDNKSHVIQIGNSKSLVKAIIDIDSKCKKIDIKAAIKDIHLKTILEDEKAEFEIFNIDNDYIKKNNLSNLLIAETRYSAKTDLLDYYNFSKFANYCRDKGFQDLIDDIKDYLIEKNQANKDDKSLRLIHKYEDQKYYIRALTSVNQYKDFGINFSAFVTLMTLDNYVKKSKNEIYINKFKVDDSNIYISFEVNNEIKINDKITLSFNLILENDEIKRSSVSFNGIFKLKWVENDKYSEIFLKPKGFKKDNSNNPVDLLSYRHSGDVETVFEKIKELPNLIDFFINQVSQDAKTISNIKEPNDVRNFIKNKIHYSRKKEFKVYKQEIINKLSSISVDNTFKLFELLRDVEELFEHDDIVSINFWRSKLYEALIEKK